MRIRAILLALLMAVGMSGQDLAFRHYSDYEGLWHNAIRALAQDKYGFIWIGADAGLYRFDGISMRSFHTSDDKSVQSVYALLDIKELPFRCLQTVSLRNTTSMPTDSISRDRLFSPAPRNPLTR